MILLDTSGLLAWLDAGQPQHGEVLRAMDEVRAPYLLSPFVLAELDYLLATRVSQAAQEALLGEVARGAFRLEAFTSDDIRRALAVMQKYSDLGIGLADASIVVLGERHGCELVLTLDERQLRTLQMDRGPFRLLPGDR